MSARLEAAVQDQMKGSNAPGLLLSGGLDFRLIASVSPKSTTCFTMVDCRNRELRTAHKAARICRRKHVPIIRDQDWTARIVEKSAIDSIGLWHWQHMTFKPLRDQGSEWQRTDRVMLGMGFDTFLKGNQVESADLWQDTWDSASAERVAAVLCEHALGDSSNGDHLVGIMQPEVLRVCRDSYRAALSAEIDRAYPMATCMPDVWEMVQFRAIHRVPYFTNLTCLREFIPARNVIFDNRLYDLYFRIPASIRRTGNVVRAALRRNDWRLAMLIDGNTWLPTCFPFALHRQSERVRYAISSIRNRLGGTLGLAMCKGHGPWPRFGVLWAQNDTMRGVMDALMDDPTAIPGELFDRGALHEMWSQHRAGKTDCTSVLNAIVSFGIFRRSAAHAAATASCS